MCCIRKCQAKYYHVIWKLVVILITILLFVNIGLLLVYGGKYAIFAAITFIASTVILLIWIILKYRVSKLEASGLRYFARYDKDVPLPGGLSNLWDDEEKVVKKKEEDVVVINVEKRNEEISNVIRIMFNMMAEMSQKGKVEAEKKNTPEIANAAADSEKNNAE